MITVMKVLLVDPVYNPGTIPPNIPLSKIAAGLMSCGIEVDTVDFVRPDCENNDLSFFRVAEADFIKDIQQKVSDCDVVYITTGTGNELKPYPIYPRVLTISKAIKRTKNVKVIVGGALINLYIKVYNMSLDVLCNEFIDMLAIGNEYHSVMNVIVNGSYPHFIVPLWNVWDLSKYPQYKSVQYHVGCPYSCDFCFEGKIYDGKSANEDINAFISSIEPGEKIIIEDSVLLSYADFDDIIDRLASKNIEFASYARISEITKEPGKIEKMKHAGCQSLIVGIETLDNNVLKGHNKNIVSSQTRLGLDILKENDIDVQGCFMLGFPEDSLNNMERTIEFAINERLKGYRWHIYQPNYANMNDSFYPHNIKVMDHLKIQTNIPDNCLAEIVNEQPELGKLDEHFMIRGKNNLSPDAFANLGYVESFSYRDIKLLIDKLFPKEWILNEEVLYKYLFKAWV